MKTMMMWACGLLLLCSCSKTEIVAPDQPATKAGVENVTVVIECRYGGGGYMNPYHMQFASSNMSQYGIYFLKFDLKNVYIDYNFNGVDPTLMPSAEIIIDGNYSESLPFGCDENTYVDASSFQADYMSDRYNVTYQVIGMPCR